MSPTLERGWAVRVEPLNGPLEYGDVILVDTVRGPLIHRYLGTVSRGEPLKECVVHAGDSSVMPGVVPSSQVSGRVCAVVRPGGRPLLALRDLPPSVQRRLARFVARERLYAHLRVLAESIPGLRPALAGVAGRRVRRLLRLG